MLEFNAGTQFTFFTGTKVQILTLRTVGIYGYTDYSIFSYFRGWRLLVLQRERECAERDRVRRERRERGERERERERERDRESAREREGDREQGG